MLDNYHLKGEADQRLLAVQAALEIVKACVGAPTGTNTAHKVKYDLENSAEQLEGLVNKIQELLK